MNNNEGLGSWIMRLTGMDFDHGTCGRTVAGSQENDCMASGDVNLDNYNDDGSII